MNQFLNLIAPSQVDALGWMLLHSIWQSVLLGMVALLGFALLRRFSAQSRYVLGVALLGSQLLLSAITYLYYLPVSTVGATSPMAGSGAPELILLPEYSLSPVASIQLWLALHLNELVIGWLVGVGILLVRFLGSWTYLQRLHFTSQVVRDKTWTTRFGLLLGKLNVGQSIELRETSRIVTPMVVVVLRPVVFIPIGLLSGISPQQFEAIMAHELAHIRRHDYLINLIQSVVEVVYFFNPVLWWLSSRIRTEREHCCDDLAVTVCGDRMSLAQALVRVAEFRQESMLAVAFAGKKPLLLQRIKRVMGIVETTQPQRFSGYFSAAILLLAFFAGFSVYAFQDLEKPDDQSETKELVEPMIKHIEAVLLPGTLIEGVAVISKKADTEQISLEEIWVIRNDTMLPAKKDQLLTEAYEKVQVLQEQMRPYQQQIQELQKRMEPLQRRVAELQLEQEKQQFEVERFQREQEKVEWKKQQAIEARRKVMERRSEVMYPKAGQPKLSESELDKQMTVFESQIKAKEEEITALNDQIAKNRKKMEEVEKPFNAIDEEMEKLGFAMDDISNKMEQNGEQIGIIGNKMEAASRNIERYLPAPPPPPRAPVAPKAPTRLKGNGKIDPPPPPARPITPMAPAPPKPKEQ